MTLEISATMYSFVSLSLYDGTYPTCRITVNGTAGNESISNVATNSRFCNMILSKLVFQSVREALGVDSAYAIEKELSGSDFSPDFRSRWWERLGEGRLDLKRALLRGDPVARMWLSKFSQRNSCATTLLAMPLWDLLPMKQSTVFDVMSYHQKIVMMGVWIPGKPAPSIDASIEFQDAFIKPIHALGDPWPSINAAAFCLRLALARGDLTTYVLTLKTIFTERWNGALSPYRLASQAWRAIAAVYSLQYAHLALCVDNEFALHWKAEDLVQRGISVQINAATAESIDDYKVPASPWPPVLIDTSTLPWMFSFRSMDNKQGSQE